MSVVGEFGVKCESWVVLRCQCEVLVVCCILLGPG